MSLTPPSGMGCRTLLLLGQTLLLCHFVALPASASHTQSFASTQQCNNGLKLAGPGGMQSKDRGQLALMGRNLRLAGGGPPVMRTKSVIEKEKRESEKVGNSVEVTEQNEVETFFNKGGSQHTGDAPIRVGPVITKRQTKLSDTYRMDLGDTGILGTGTFSTVRVATHKQTGEQFAVKAISLKHIQPQTLIRLRREIQVLRSLNHKNIIHLYEIFEEGDMLYMIMELCTGGELWNFLQQVEIFPNGDKFYYSSKGRVALTESNVASMVKGIVEAIQYCHGRKVCHRDLKLENLMLAHEEDNADIKLIDFGFSKVFQNTNSMFAILGSPYYVAPEVLHAKAPRPDFEGVGYGAACDLWSIGVITYMILCGQAPFDGETDQERLTAVRHGSFTYPDHANLSKEATDFINRLLTVDPAKRMTARQAMNHPWIRDCKEKRTNHSRPRARFLFNLW